MNFMVVATRYMHTSCNTQHRVHSASMYSATFSRCHCLTDDGFPTNATVTTAATGCDIEVVCVKHVVQVRTGFPFSQLPISYTRDKQ